MRKKLLSAPRLIPAPVSAPIQPQAVTPKRVPALLSIWPQAGRIAGTSRGTAFRAAASGAWPTTRSGKRLWVVTAKFEELIGRKIEASDLT